MALRKFHEDPARAWSVAQLAREAALSRSGFFERFSRVMGVSPMTYLLTWRMALAKQWLCQDKMAVSEVAQRTGYGSSSTFTVAFTRHTGVSPARYGRTKTPVIAAG
ncbi:AraC family transcriptional regulator [Pseudomonas baltica]|uniref:helix-turn-helix transcriptional regulator n=1 Tax=Pseudomonas baltica TaxID=2762576 RepID=UPI00289F3A6C|nr:AraC family transcriptional regulator [Pseudomonas baltica]